MYDKHVRAKLDASPLNPTVSILYAAGTYPESMVRTTEKCDRNKKITEIVSPDGITHSKALRTAYTPHSAAAY